MKSHLLNSLFLLLLSTACSNSTNNTAGFDSVNASNLAAGSRQSEVDTSVNNIGNNRSQGEPAHAQLTGAQLIANSDCVACHKEAEASIGPSYKDIAQKYPSDTKSIDYIAGTIINGGKGVWGPTPMAPHSDISRADAREMARYILQIQ